MEIFKAELITSSDISDIAARLRAGELCVVPTETVYGLAANALIPEAVDGIFKAKNRPNDNPLTVHIGAQSDMERFARDIPDSAYLLSQKFWPGPLTMVLLRSDLVPEKISAGAPTVALRMPDNEVACRIITAAGDPIVATSANISGSPSPTTLAHVLDDMGGKVSAIVDGGDLELGIESTVINMLTNPPRILRLGSLGVEEIERVIGPVEFDESSAPASAHRHYSIGKRAVLIKSSLEKFNEYIADKSDFAVLCFDGESFSVPHISYGGRDDSSSLGRGLFAALRELEGLEVSAVFMRCPEGDDALSAAVKARLMKTADNNFVEL
ncbi:MAG: threonylcarbamoyl-AMP synthase [Clostridia bacterium]|nr:threonylcarbamoyl-AMP synthase [Clostridia bacterium]